MGEIPLALQLVCGLALAMVTVYAATPVAIRIANRLDFVDRPRGYRGHTQPTPYLGGAAVVAGFAVVVLLLTREPNHTLPILGGVVVLWVVGTIDDRRTVPPLQRVVVEVALAAMLWEFDLGWSVGLGGAVDLVATAAWVVAVVNAFNLFDNMDGASSAMAFVVASAVAVLGVVQADVWLTVTAAALGGACLGFLPHNLARPSARIFLGDGGSMPVGFAVAALVMVGASTAATEWQALVMGLLLVGVPALDTCLVVVSRRRRRISILTGGRDHLTHRTRARLRTAQGVAVALGGAQALLSALALVAVRGGSALLVPAVMLYLVLLVTVIAVLDRTPKDPPPEAGTTSPVAVGERGMARLRGRPLRLTGLAPLLGLGLVLGLSPFWHGYYDSSIWVPGGLGLLVLVTACAIARPVELSRPAILALSAFAALALWALASALWTDSIEGAVVDANRMLVYVAAMALLAVLLRSDRRAAWTYAAVVAGALAVAVWVVAGLLRGDGSLLLGGRLNEPLAYINGEACFFVLALWPCLALAEHKRSPLAAGAGLAGATLFASLVTLSQSRGAVLAVVGSVIFVCVLIPGRPRRAVALVVMGLCLAPSLPTLLDVYSSPGASDLRSAGLAVMLSCVAAGVLWAVAMAAERRTVASGGDAGRRLHRAIVVVLSALALTATVAGVIESGRIGGFADRQYTAFVKLGGQAGEPTASRLSSGAGNRYDYWRVAVRAWRSDPIVGLGAGGYDKPYFLQRSTTEDIRQPHSLPLQVLAELGLVGALLLAAILAAVGLGARRRIARLRLARARSPVVLASVGIASAWFIHTSVDWMHLLPGVTGIALIATVVLLRSDVEPAKPRRRARDDRASLAWRVGPIAAAALVIALAASSLSRQGLSELYVGRGQRALAAHPADALKQANRALRLDREAIAAYYTKAAAIARSGDGVAAQAVLLDAARREPRNYVTWTLLGDLAVRRDDQAAARRYYGRAAALNPRDAELARLTGRTG